MREITYCKAIQEAIYQEMERDETVFVYGIGVPDHKAIFGSIEGILEKFGPERCKDTPISEDSMTGVGIGASLGGLKPIHIHIRVDFLLIAMNQIVNSMSTILYNSGGKLNVPLVIRAVVGRGWGQGSQHSKSMFSTFAHIPGIKVIAPTTPSDAKGMLISAIRDDNPVIMLEHRWLYWQRGNVQENPYKTPLGKANILRKGTDITIVATSWMNVEAVQASEMLDKYHKISAEVIDVRCLNPLDIDTIIDSVTKTKRCLIADNDWKFCGFSAEIASQIYEKIDENLQQKITRIGFPNVPCPTVRHLENAFYPNANDIFRSIEEMFELAPVLKITEKIYSNENKFKGPF